MSTSVTLPALGESVTEGTVSRWLKQVGDTVEADEPLLEVSTDKVDTEIPSPASGVLLEIKAQEDETVEVGAVLAVIGEPSEADGQGAEAPEAPSEEAAETPPKRLPRRRPRRKRRSRKPSRTKPSRRKPSRRKKSRRKPSQRKLVRSPSNQRLTPKQRLRRQRLPLAPAARQLAPM